MKEFPPLGFVYIDESQFAQVCKIVRVEGFEGKFEDGRRAKAKVHFDDGSFVLTTHTVDQVFGNLSQLIQNGSVER